MVSLADALVYYKRKEIQQAILAQAANKEVVGSFNGQSYAKRPDILQYPQDVLSLVQQGVTSFHASEELWTNPLHIVTGMSKDETLRLRKGWDLVLDIDCHDWVLSQYSAEYIVKALEYMGIQSLSIKFSGNHGFHIGVPFEAFPEDIQGKKTKTLFPDAPRRIAAYIQHLIRDQLKKKLLEHFSLLTIATNAKKELSAILTNGEFDPFKAVSIDTILISSRHLYRMAYSFNEKSGLISLPIDPKKIMEFSLQEAQPQAVKVTRHFLERTSITPLQANQLILQAYDFKPNIELPKEEKHRDYEELKEAIPETFFPECIKKILGGIDDGKKRAVFILVNFLRSVGWTKDQIEEKIYQWNTMNKAPLREVYIKSQLRHAFEKTSVLPPSCKNEMYYKDLGVQCEARICERWKNPVAVAKRSVYRVQREELPKKEQLTEEQKELRRKFRAKKGEVTVNSSS